MDSHRVGAKRSTRFPGMAGGTERDTEPVTLPRCEENRPQPAYATCSRVTR